MRWCDLSCPFWRTRLASCCPIFAAVWPLPSFAIFDSISRKQPRRRASLFPRERRLVGTGRRRKPLRVSLISRAHRRQGISSLVSVARVGFKLRTILRRFK